jgi:hypothetical protein
VNDTKKTERVGADDKEEENVKRNEEESRKNKGDENISTEQKSVLKEEEGKGGARGEEMLS